MLVSATPLDLAQIKSALAGIDASVPAPSVAPIASDAVKILQRRPADIARGLSREVPHVRVAVSGPTADLHVVVPNGMQAIILTCSPQAVRDAKDLIVQLDVVPQSVVLDTEILELDENTSRNLGLELGTTSIGTTFTEVVPPTQANGQPGYLGAFQPLARTPISFQAQINLLLQNGSARVLADPRITTLSGHTATIRAGDTISILTTVGGGTGTVATTQLESFQTGVTLDITPIITDAGELSVALHPVVNSLTGYLNGVPQISTRDTQTTVHLRDNQTLVIGGPDPRELAEDREQDPVLRRHPADRQGVPQREHDQHAQRVDHRCHTARARQRPRLRPERRNTARRARTDAAPAPDAPAQRNLPRSAAQHAAAATVADARFRRSGRREERRQPTDRRARYVAVTDRAAECLRASEHLHLRRAAAQQLRRSG
jgi:hypothetical protein